MLLGKTYPDAILKPLSLLQMKRFILFLFLFLATVAQAQKGQVRGRVVDANTGENVEYATIALLNLQDSTLRGWGHISDGPQLYRFVKNHRLSPTLTIGFSYKINNGLKQQPQLQESDEAASESIY